MERKTWRRRCWILNSWPRAFAVAGGLWSAQDVSGSDNMYQQLGDGQRWSTVSVGLPSNLYPAAGAVHALSSSGSTAAAESRERWSRRHYSASIWEFRANHYHLFEPLNRLADALPAEMPTDAPASRARWASRLISDAETAAKARMRCTPYYHLWQNNIADARGADGKRSYQLAAIKPVVAQVDESWRRWGYG